MNEILITASLCFCALALVAHSVYTSRAATGKLARGGTNDVLDNRFLELNTGVPYCNRDIVQGCLILGQTGSGKTSGPLFTILRNAMQSGFGLTLLCAKPSDRADYLAMAKKTGREKDVIVIDQTAAHRLNFFDSFRMGAADEVTMARMMSQALDVFAEISSRSGAKSGGGDDQFWVNSYKRKAFVVILLLLLADEPVTPANILAVVHSLPRSPKDLTLASWKDKYCSHCLRTAFARCNADGRKESFRICDEYITLEICTLASKTRSIITAFLTGVLDVLSTGIASKVLASESTFNLADAIARNAIIIVDFPYSAWQQVGQFIAGGIKHLVEIEILKRSIKPETLPHLIGADEAANVLTEYDQTFISMSRQFRGTLVGRHALIDG
ncbi:type IV secretory system conjugative DNA transfer family protein [Limnoglobus roseus]|uniref:TraD/TraG TraM recognition site domain-containing protein n=1 Tax=Limnoglobus roseus TaxID=2598579 RepID=A0A5C1AK82_9BACT|nr:hypothetical protein [Limnoglobus roseus]QEL19290.1 hypothetical protein PX52LOC_06353 [Limnoglobus roseus]